MSELNIPQKKTTTFPWRGLIAILVGLFWLHFYDFSAFYRNVIKFDDQIWVEPLFKMSLSEYFTSWLPNPTRMAFPVRDLIYMAEGRLNSFLPFKTYWLTNFLIYAVWTTFLAKIYFLIKPKIQYVLGATAFFAFHPINFDLIQWLSLRKHSLAFLFITIASYQSLKVYKENRDLKRKDWAIIVGFALLSLGSWGTAILWPLWLLYLFRKRLWSDWQNGLLITTSTLVGLGFYLRSFSPPGSPYAKIIESVSVNDLTGFWKLASSGLLGLGRGMFDLMIPVQVVLYSDRYSFLNYIGLTILFLIILFSIYSIQLIRKNKWPRFETLELSVILLGLALLLPSLANSFVASDMFWNSRYLSAGIPLFLTPILFYLLDIASSRFSIQTARTVSLAYLALILTISILISLPRVKSWNSSLTVFESCYEKEQSPRCLSYLIEQTISEKGCAQAYRYFEDSQAILKKREDIKFSELPYTYSFFEAYCNATIVNMTPEAKIELVSQTKANAPSSYATLFSETLLEIESKGEKQALNYLIKRYFDDSMILTQPVVGMIANSLEGQLEYLCDKTPAPDCPDQLTEAKRRSERFGMNPIHKNWAYQTTLKHPHPGTRKPASKHE